MAETDPKMEKQTANAPVARASWRPGRPLDVGATAAGGGRPP